MKSTVNTFEILFTNVIFSPS